MSEARHLQGIEGSAERDFDPRYTLRHPTMEDVSNLAGFAARGISADVLNAIANGREMDAMVAAFGAAFSDATAREDLMFALGVMWEHEPTNLDAPHEEWDYYPTEAQIKNGMPTREAQWMSLKRSSRKKIIKRYELEALPWNVVKDMWASLAAKTDVSDFLTTALSQAGASSGESTTASSAATDGPTDE